MTEHRENRSPEDYQAAKQYLARRAEEAAERALPEAVFDRESTTQA